MPTRGVEIPIVYLAARPSIAMIPLAVPVVMEASTVPVAVPEIAMEPAAVPVVMEASTVPVAAPETGVQTALPSDRLAQATETANPANRLATTSSAKAALAARVAASLCGRIRLGTYVMEKTDGLCTSR